MFKINQVFNQHGALKPLLQEADHRQQLQRYWAQAAPEFGAFSQVLALSENTLTIGTSSGIVANKIRLLEHNLLLRLQEICQKSKQINGLNINAIKVKVQVKSPAPARQKRIKPLSTQALTHLQNCAEAIENPALQQALQTLIQHQKNR